MKVKHRENNLTVFECLWEAERTALEYFNHLVPTKRAGLSLVHTHGHYRFVAKPGLPGFDFLLPEDTFVFENIKIATSMAKMFYSDAYGIDCGIGVSDMEEGRIGLYAIGYPDTDIFYCTIYKNLKALDTTIPFLTKAKRQLHRFVLPSRKKRD